MIKQRGDSGQFCLDNRGVCIEFGRSPRCLHKASTIDEEQRENDNSPPIVIHGFHLVSRKIAFRSYLQRICYVRMWICGCSKIWEQGYINFTSYYTGLLARWSSINSN